MSTNPKDLNPKESSETHIKTSKRSVDASLRNLQKEMEQENTLVQETPVGRLQRVSDVFLHGPLRRVLRAAPGEKGEQRHGDGGGTEGAGHGILGLGFSYGGVARRDRKRRCPAHTARQRATAAGTRTPVPTGSSPTSSNEASAGGTASSSPSSSSSL